MPAFADVDVTLAQILICNVGVRRELARLKSERRVMTPKLNGLASTLKKFKHDMEAAVAPLVSEMETIGPDCITEIKKAKEHVASVRSMRDDLASFNKELEGSNGGPSLDDSQGSSEASGHDGEPGKSWANGQT